MSQPATVPTFQIVDRKCNICNKKFKSDQLNDTSRDNHIASGRHQKAVEKLRSNEEDTISNALITDSNILALLESGICIDELVNTSPSLTKHYVIELKNKSNKKWNRRKRKQKQKTYDNNNHSSNEEKHEDEFPVRFKTINKKIDFITKQKHKQNVKQRNKCCLIIVIADDNDMRIDAHKIIFKAQQARGYQTYSMMFESKEIKLAVKNNTFHQQQIYSSIQAIDNIAALKNGQKLQIFQDLKCNFHKIIILGHCNYYTIHNQNSYINEPYLSHVPKSIYNRFICGLNIVAMSEFIKYIITQLRVYYISLCCCESATKNVHLECEILDELTEDEKNLYEIVKEYRLKNDISVKPQFANKNDEKDKHLFVAFKYEMKYAQLVGNLIRNGIEICNHSLSVLDLISHELYEQNISEILEKPLFINALNGFGYYRHPDMSIYEIDELKKQMMDMLNLDDDEKESNEIMSCIFNLDKQFPAGPLRNDCIYYSIKNRDGVQWLIDKDHNNLHKKRNWCQFELTQILDIDQQEAVNDGQWKYDEKYFVDRPHVIQYQFHPLSRTNN